jgi:ketosteroid isomerase-like protein
MGNSDEATIRQLHYRFVEANRVTDSQFLRDHMAPGADGLLWYNLNQSNYVGVDHIVELWDTLRAAMGGKPAERAESREERFTIVGDAALVTYMFDIAADFGELGKFVQTGRTTEVWRRIDGEWKMIHFHCSNHVPGVMGGK